uniref:Acetylxylan esterase n=1 Tax=Roseihalotalea indica TaxID=2867963 RepID=A0AA49GK35_9BACT|nr:acetylxylan esterase [Tunicatimonas sp. TK19036]
MNKTQQLFLALFLLTTLTNLSYAQQIILKQSNESGIYQKGAQVQVNVELKDIESDTLSVKVLKNYGDETQERFEYTGKPVAIYDETVDEPTSLIFEVEAGGESASIGLVVDPESFEPGTERPKDLDRYWKQEKKALRKLPMDMKTTPVDDIQEGYTCSDVELTCLGPKPARGYFAKPEGAAPKSLPIVLYVHAAGVKGSWCLAQPENAMRYATMGKGALAFDLNAHGMLNGQPQSYYDSLEENELNQYYKQGVESRQDFYFRGMYLRLLRTLDYLTSQPEWDGERILVIGESQGGGQALAAAGLDPRVTAAVATVPAMCDWGGLLVGRKGGWPNPLAFEADEEKMQQTLPYFDAAHLLKDCKATLVTEIGFIDMTCPSISIYAAINQAEGEKIVYGVPYRGHHVDQKEFQETWEKTVYQPKMDFITDFLK